MNEKKCKLSVIIPVYNVEPYLEECIDSMLNQDIGEYEIILVDDGSTDGSTEICRQYAEKYSFVNLIEKENGGQGSARNVGLAVAQGEYIYFSDSDDYISANCLKRLYLQAKEHDLDILFFGADSFGEKHPVNPAYKKTHIYECSVPGKELFIRLLENREYACCVPMYIVRKSLLVDHDIQFDTDTLHEDELYTYQVMREVRYGGVMNECFYHRRYRNMSTMRSAFTYRKFKGCARACRAMLDDYMCGLYSPEQREYVGGYLLQMFKNAALPEISLSAGEKPKYENTVKELQQDIRKAKYCHSLLGVALCHALGLYRIYMRTKRKVRNVTFR